MPTEEAVTTSLDPTEYLDAYRNTHEPSGAASADLWVRHLVRFLDTRTLSAEELYRWRARLVEERYAPSSINKAIQTVRPYLKYLRIRGLHTLDTALIGDALTPARVASMLPVVLTREEVKALCDKHSTYTFLMTGNTPIEHTGFPTRPVATFLALGLLTGMRPGEILRCRPEHHHPDRGLLVYATKTGRERVIPLGDNPELAMLLSGATATPTYCAGFSTFHWDTFCKAALGRTINRKLLRSTHSSYVASSGKIRTEFEYMSRLGHSVDVANAHYRSMITGVTGDDVASWLGAKAEIGALVKRICQ